MITDGGDGQMESAGVPEAHKRRKRRRRSARREIVRAGNRCSFPIHGELGGGKLDDTRFALDDQDYAAGICPAHSLRASAICETVADSSKIWMVLPAR